MNTTATMLVYGVGAALVALSADSANNILRDASYWAEYKRIDFVEQRKDGIVFRSFDVIKKPVKVSWNDVLECKINRHEYAFYSSNKPTSKRYNKPVNNLKIGKPWVYHGAAPEQGICKMRAEITYTTLTSFMVWKIPFSKTQIIYSKPFYIRDLNNG